MLERTIFRSRVARRFFLVFLLCALIPFVVSAFIALSELKRLTERRDVERLGESARSAATSFVSRLYSADETLRALLSDSESSLDWLRLRGTRYFVFASLRTVPPAPQRPDDALYRYLPWPNATQRAALQQGRSIVLWSHFPDPTQGRPFLVRMRHRSEPWIYAELRTDSLWDFVVLDGDDAVNVALYAHDGRKLLGTRADASDFESRIMPGLRHADRAGLAGHFMEWRVDEALWRANVTEVFLSATFSAPSVYVATLQAPAGTAAEIRSLRAIFPAVTLLAVLLAMWLAIRQIRRTLTPLDTLMRATTQVGQGNFQSVPATDTADEFSDLATSFNQMSDRLKNQFASLAAMSEVDRLLLGSTRLETVLEAISPPILAVCGCQVVTVLLVDDAESGRIRFHEYRSGDSHGGAVSRGAIAPKNLATLLNETATYDSAFMQRILPPANRDASMPHCQHWEVLPLRHGNNASGALILGYTDCTTRDAVAANSLEFAARLTVVMRNLAHEAQLYEQAHYDSLTGLPNRGYFRSKLADAIAQCLSRASSGALLFLDLDHFKRINDTAGHPAGDELLIQVSARLRAAVSPQDTVARLGGDEFAIILGDIARAEEARQRAADILASIAAPLRLNDRVEALTGSIGISTFPGDSIQVDALIKNSDIALYRAKELGRNQIVSFDDSMLAQMYERSSIEDLLRQTLQQQGFMVHYQAIGRSSDRRVVAAEALIRCRDPKTQAIIPPAKFIGIAEETGLIEPIGYWILEQACIDMMRWRQMGAELDYISVNVSPRQLAAADFVKRTAAILAKHQMPAQCLQLEVTESVLADREGAATVLNDLHALGIRIALDDFGTGYSSLSYLRNYPFDTVKIDRSFVIDLPHDAAACRLAETILNMAHGLEKYAVAEGVETQEQFDYLRARSCDAMQGYLLGRPVDSATFAQCVAPPTGVEPVAYRLGGGRSIH